MKTLIYGIAILMAIGCTKEDPKTLSNEKSIEKFVGIWKTQDFGGNAFEVVIQKFDETTILLHGQITAKPIGDIFESEPMNGVVHAGELISGKLNYCQSMSGTSVCGDFLK